MTILQYLSAFRLFGGDVLVLGLAVTVLVSVFKKTVLKKAPKKLFVFLPFVLGTVVFGVYRCIAELSIAPLAENIRATLDSGFACGCAATLYYVVYEQFLRVKSAAPAQTTGSSGATVSTASEAVSTASEAGGALERALGAILSAEDAAEAARVLKEGGAALSGEGFSAFAEETLARYAPQMSAETRKSVAAIVKSAMA